MATENTANPIKLKKLERVKITRSGSGNFFPDNLSENRTMAIKIYDTAKDDPNAALSKSTHTAIDSQKSAYLGVTKAYTDKEKTNLFEKAWAGVKAVGTTVGNVVVNLTDTVGTQAKAYADYHKTFENYGNVPLPADPWMDNLYLPLPNEIQESLSHSYSTEETGFMQSGAIGGITSSITGPVTKASNAVSKATGRQHLITNENKLSWFQSTEFRSITLTWTLIPNNAKESNNIQNIITKLKAYSSAQAVAGKLLLRAPFYCKLEFANTVIQNALQFNECVMTNIEVNYSVTGNMETFSDDNMPKTMQLSITFQDREPKTLQAWAEGQGGYEKSAGPTSVGKSSGPTASAGAAGAGVRSDDEISGWY